LRARVLSGALDDQLIYRKRLRRDVDAYASAPPHVKAARLLADAEPESTVPANDVEYVITTHGAEPLMHRTGPIDYGHYLDKQLAPAVDVALGLLGTSFEQVAGAQLRLF
jgi:DNA polymerase-2